MRDSESSINRDQAAAIGRLSTLERLREQARNAQQPEMVKSVEHMIEQELRLLQRLRAAGSAKSSDTASA